jgi:hypothetical protein
MKLTPEIEAKGLRAYEQARAFERMRTWRLPLGYVVLVLLLILTAISLWRIGRMGMAEFNFVVAGVMVVVEVRTWRRLKMRYAENLKLLAELEQTYGEELPWIQVEKHLAALDELKRELAEEAGTGRDGESSRYS